MLIQYFRAEAEPNVAYKALLALRTLASPSFNTCTRYFSTNVCSAVFSTCSNSTNKSDGATQVPLSRSFVNQFLTAVYRCFSVDFRPPPGIPNPALVFKVLKQVVRVPCWRLVPFVTAPILNSRWACFHRSSCLTAHFNLSWGVDLTQALPSLVTWRPNAQCTPVWLLPKSS